MRARRDDQAPAAQTTAGARISPCSVTTPATAPRARGHRLDRAVQVQRGAVSDGRPRERVGGLLGIGVAVAGRVHAAHPAARQAGDHRVEVAGAEQASRQAELAGQRQPRLESRHPRLVGGEREVAALDPLDVGVQLALEALPEPVGLDDEGELERIAPLLADEAPVLPGLLAGHGSPAR